ncbi:MAG: glycosyltransferase family 4 protein [Chloroflexota bacterium]
MPLKIGIVTGEYPPHQGGVGDFTREIAHALADLGHEVHIVTHINARPEGFREAPRSEAERAKPFGSLTIHPVVASWNLQSLISIRQLAHDLKLDLLNIQYQAAAYGMTPPIHFLPLVVGVPCVMTFHDLRVPYLFPKAGALRWQAIMLLAKTSAGVIVTNPEDRLTLEKNLWNADDAERARKNADKMLVEIPIGSNIKANSKLQTPNSKKETRRKYGIGEDDVVIGYFGFLNASKGGETLFRAISQLPITNYRLLLIGGRSGTSDPTNQAYAEQLDSLANELGISDRIIRTGYLSSEETTQAFRACDMMAMPYEDGASFRRGTFMACLVHGMPTITTQPSISLPQLKHGENIFFISSGSPFPLSSAISELANDSNLRAQLSRGALELSDQFTWDKIAKRTGEFFERVLIETR